MSFDMNEIDNETLVGSVIGKKAEVLSVGKSDESVALRHAAINNELTRQGVSVSMPAPYSPHVGTFNGNCVGVYGEARVTSSFSPAPTRNLTNG